MSKSFASLSVLCAIVVVALSTSASAETVYLASSFETLYRVTPEREIESWDFPGIDLRGMHRDLTTGHIFVLGDEGGHGAPATVYILNNAVSGTPTLTEYAALSRQYGTLTQVGGTLYGFSHDELYTIDLSNPASPLETYVGTTGVRGMGGAAYDPVGDALYMTSYWTDMLYTVEPDTAALTPIGEMGINADGLGAEWFDGQLFVAAQNLSTGNVEIGTLDVTTGSYSLFITLASGANNQPTAITVIPEPTTLSLLLAGCALVLRRSHRMRAC